MQGHRLWEIPYVFWGIAKLFTKNRRQSRLSQRGSAHNQYDDTYKTEQIEVDTKQEPQRNGHNLPAAHTSDHMDRHTHRRHHTKEYQEHYQKREDEVHNTSILLWGCEA